MFGFIACIFSGYLVLLTVMYFGQRHLMYQPGVLMGSPETYGVPEMKVLTLSGRDKTKLSSWLHIPYNDEFVIIYFHGNAGSIGDRASKIMPYLEAGFGVVLAGYRGFEGNPGSPTEIGLYEDAATVLEHLEQLGVPSERWVLYGESLGTGVATEMASRYASKQRPVASLILEAPFTSMVDAASEHYPYIPVRFLVHDKYDSISKITAIETPLLVVHGTDDRTIPQKLGLRIFDLAKEPKRSLWVEGAGHNNLYDFGVADQIIQYIRQIQYDATHRQPPDKQ